MLPPTLTTLTTFIAALLAMAFFTLLERKILGYSQLRKGPNKTALSGIPQPMADALKLFLKELPLPSLVNPLPFSLAPMMGLLLALLLWTLYPLHHPAQMFTYGAMAFLCLSSLNVYTTMGAGWASNSKYALLGALRSVAQTISYEISMVLIILAPLATSFSLSLTLSLTSNPPPPILLFPPLAAAWFITILAETNRAPFDFAEGESELVSGFNTEYSGGGFAMIFMAEYTNILLMSLLTTSIFFQPPLPLQPLLTTLISTLFLLVRATLPRMRYDHLMGLTWKILLFLALSSILSSLALLQPSPLLPLFQSALDLALTPLNASST